MKLFEDIENDDQMRESQREDVSVVSEKRFDVGEGFGKGRK